MNNAEIKENAQILVKNLPAGATWDDLMYEIYVRQTIESGMADCDAGKVTDVRKVREKYGLMS